MHKGSCHCGAIQFQVDVDLSQGATRCNCTVCAKIAYTTAIVKPAAFTLLAGDESRGEYEWGTRSGQRSFCKSCGIHCFARGYLEQIGGDYVGINVNCLDEVDANTLTIRYWDGRHDNWQAGARDTPWPSA